MAGSLLALLAAGCTVDERPRPAPIQDPSRTVVRGPACAAPTNHGTGPGQSSSPAEPAAMPASLAGAWACTTSTTAIRFTFSTDGTYRSVESLAYEIPRGWFRFRREQAGTATVAGDTLKLQPIRSVRTRSMPEDPKGDYVDRPEPLTPRRFTFHADAHAIRLRENGGPLLILTRQA